MNAWQLSIANLTSAPRPPAVDVPVKKVVKHKYSVRERCSDCGEMRLTREFLVVDKVTGRRKMKCLKCRKLYFRRYREKNGR